MAHAQYRLKKLWNDATEIEDLKNWVKENFAPIESPTFTGTVTIPVTEITDECNIPGGRIWIAS